MGDLRSLESPSTSQAKECCADLLMKSISPIKSSDIDKANFRKKHFPVIYFLHNDQFLVFHAVGQENPSF